MALKEIPFDPAKRTPEEHFAVLEEQLLNVLRSGKAQVSDDFMDHLSMFDRCLRLALGLPVKPAN